jgi:hypothetical protein
MAGDADLVLIGDRHHMRQEIIDPFPEGIGIDHARAGKRQLLLQRVLVIPLVVQGIAPAAYRAAAHHAQDAHIVFQGGDAGGGAVADQVLERLDIAIPLGALRQHDGGMGLAVDIGGIQQHTAGELQMHAMLLDSVPQRLELIGGRIDTGWIADGGCRPDPFHTKTRKIIEALVADPAQFMAQPGLQRRKFPRWHGFPARRRRRHALCRQYSCRPRT